MRLLMRFLFDYEQIRRPVATLSGGERTRLAFLGLMQDKPNCLVLDEPTNHLDIDSIEVLEDALERFDGTVIAVSHDRYFLDRIADRIVLVADGEVRSFEGGWSANAGVLVAGYARGRRREGELAALERELDRLACRRRSSRPRGRRRGGCQRIPLPSLPGITSSTVWRSAGPRRRLGGGRSCACPCCDRDDELAGAARDPRALGGPCRRRRCGRVLDAVDRDRGRRRADICGSSGHVGSTRDRCGERPASARARRRPRGCPRSSAARAPCRPASRPSRASARGLLLLGLRLLLLGLLEQLLEVLLAEHLAHADLALHQSANSKR